MGLASKLEDTQKLPELKPCDIKGRYRLAVSAKIDDVFLAGDICADPKKECSGINIDCLYFQSLNKKYLKEISQ